MPISTGRLHVPASAVPEEAAAIVAAIERFITDTAPAMSSAEEDHWARAAILEGVQREDPQLGEWAPISARA